MLLRNISIIMVSMVEIGFCMPAGLEVRKLDVYWQDSPQSKTSGISFTYTEVNVLVGETVDQMLKVKQVRNGMDSHIRLSSMAVSTSKHSMLFYYWQNCPQGKFQYLHYSEVDFRVFHPTGAGQLLHAKFTFIDASMGHGTPKLKFYEIWEFKCPTWAYPLYDSYKIFSIYG